MDSERLEKALDRLNGSREVFRELLLDKDVILMRICENARRVAEKQRCDPWVVISTWTSHGSGVSAAIYELYRKQEVGK